VAIAIVRRLRALGSVLALRELTVVVGVAAAFAFFAITASGVGFLTLTAADNYLEVAAEIGIIAAPVTLLMVAGEFDLSVGSMVGATEIVIGYVITQLHWSLLAALVVAAAFAAIVGAVMANLIVRTRLPSFIVTLAALFLLLGAAQGFSLNTVGETTIPNISQPIQHDWLLPLFNSSPFGLPVALFWWIGVTAIAAWVLNGLRFGNWIFAAGGSPDSAAKAGVPILRVKTILFVASALCCALVACLSIFQIDEANANAGQNLVFEVVTACVIGGTLINGGWGSPVGTAFAALLFGIVSQGFFFTNVPQVWYEAFVGGMLLAAVLINKYTAELSIRAWNRRLARRSPPP
jgi:simple sugar transport system permease protein